jgi:hypothetical protein
LIVAATALVLVGGGLALAVQQRDTACERYEAAVARDDYASFEEQQGELAKALAECMAEEAGTTR